MQSCPTFSKFLLFVLYSFDKVLTRAGPKEVPLIQQATELHMCRKQVKKVCDSPNGGAESLKRKRPEGFIQLGDKDQIAQNMAHTVLDESFMRVMPLLPCLRRMGIGQRPFRD